MNVPTQVAVRQQTLSPIGAELSTRTAQRRAWFFLLASFSVFCCLVVISLSAAVSYRRSATDSPAAALRIDRGIVLYQDHPESAQIRGRSGMDVFEGGSIEASEGTSAVISFFDGSEARVFPGASVQLAGLRTGVFNQELTKISLNQRQGAVTYSIAGQLPFGRDVTVSTPHGTVNLTRGDITVWIEDNSTRVLSYDGRGKVESGVRQVRFRDGQRVVLGDGMLPRDPLPIAENLVKNGELSQGLQSWVPIDIRERGRTDVLGTRNIETELIAGLRTSAVHFFRDSQKDSHNETGISQEILRDVTPYRAINLTGWVKVNFASLSGGGYLGSEFPMMVRVHFTDDKGSRQVWSKGFFYANPENRPTEFGEQIPRGEWYPFLVRLHQLPDRPTFIRSIEVVSSGHDFDALASYIQIVTE
ncbi:MAG: hypothetical protein ACKVVP_05815 [Chloroflexota bacterium]